MIHHILENFANAVEQLSKETKVSDPISKLLIKKINTVFGLKDFSGNFLSCLKSIGNYVREYKKLPIIVKARKTNEYTQFDTPLITITGIENIQPEAV